MPWLGPGSHDDGVVAALDRARGRSSFGGVGRDGLLAVRAGLGQRCWRLWSRPKPCRRNDVDDEGHDVFTGSGGELTRGKRAAAFVQRPAAASTHICPLAWRTIPNAVESPRPVPWAVSLGVEKRSKAGPRDYFGTR